VAVTHSKTCRIEQGEEGAEIGHRLHDLCLGQGVCRYGVHATWVGLPIGRAFGVPNQVLWTGHAGKERFLSAKCKRMGKSLSNEHIANQARGDGAFDIYFPFDVM
jgi:hypothetical protein